MFWQYTNNANVVDAGSVEQGTSTRSSDSFGSLEATLPVARRLRSGSIGLRYKAGYFKYVENTRYDNLAHGLDLNFERKLGQGMSLRFDAFGALSQDQGVPEKIDDQELFLTLRTERKTYGATVRFDRESRRQYWKVTVFGGRSEFDPVDEPSPIPPPGDGTVLALVPEDRTQTGLRLEYTRKLSRRISLGPRYDLALSDLDTSPDETYHLLGLYTRWEVAEYFTLGLTLGMYERQRDEAATAGTPELVERDWYWIADVRLDPPLAAFQRGKIRLGLDVGIQPTGGGALPGTSTNSYVWLYLGSGTAATRWSWQVGSRYTRRDSTLDDQPTFETAGFEATLERFVARLLSVRLGAGYSEQVNQDSGDTAASFSNARVGLVIYPNRR